MLLPAHRERLRNPGGKRGFAVLIADNARVLDPSERRSGPHTNFRGME